MTHTQAKLILDSITTEAETTKKTHGECTWREDCGWETSCGELFEFTADGPKENRFGFCPFCGGVLRIANPITPDPK
jgi:hypothetical protein